MSPWWGFCRVVRIVTTGSRPVATTCRPDARNRPPLRRTHRAADGKNQSQLHSIPHPRQPARHAAAEAAERGVEGLKAPSRLESHNMMTTFTIVEVDRDLAYDVEQLGTWNET